MHLRGLFSWMILAGAALATGCTHLAYRQLPKVDLPHYKHIFVERNLTDSYGIADEMARQLREMGYDASSGALTMMPAGTDLRLTFDDLWTWDFKTYMIELDVQVHLATSGKTVALVHYNRPSMVFGSQPSEMIHTVLLKLFKHA